MNIKQGKMMPVIQKEYDDFKRYHKNKYNVLFHIICGFLYMTFFFLLFKNYCTFFMIFYCLLLYFTTSQVYTSLIIFIGLFALLSIFKKMKFTYATNFTLFIIFYFLPDLSHYLTNEPTLLTLSNVTPLNAFTNVFYLLPFSLFSLSNIK